MVRKVSRIQIWSACLGNLFEHYDSALFGFLSIFLAPMIFPMQDPLTGLILTYAIIPLGMLARPLGALFFGYIGDLYGRNLALFWSLAGMSILSGFIAFTPTYSQVGVLAPIFFCFGRVLQNFFSAGETIGGAVFLLENTPQKHQDLLSSIYSASTIGGILVASFGVTYLSHFGMIEEGWRFLYLVGCLTGVFGCFIRSRMDVNAPSKTSIKMIGTFSHLTSVLWRFRKEILLIAVVSGFSYASYSTALVLMNGFIPLVSSLTKAEIMRVNTGLLVLDFCALPFFGWVASRVSREKMMLFASLSIAICAIPLFLLLKEATLFMVILVRICFVLLGVVFCAPFHAWAQQLIPSAHRYLVIAFGYAIGSQVFGGPTSAIALWCFKQSGQVGSASWYLVALAIGSSLAISFSLRSRFLLKNG